MSKFLTPNAKTRASISVITDAETAAMRHNLRAHAHTDTITPDEETAIENRYASAATTKLTELRRATFNRAIDLAFYAFVILTAIQSLFRTTPAKTAADTDISMIVGSLTVALLVTAAIAGTCITAALRTRYTADHAGAILADIVINERAKTMYPDAYDLTPTGR